MAFPQTVSEVLNSLVVTILRQHGTTDTDVVTKQKPLWRLMVERGGGMLETRDPNIWGFAERLMHETEANIFSISRTQDLQSKVGTNPDAYTEARYQWIMDIAYLQMGQFQYNNTKTKEALVNWVMAQKKPVQIAMLNNLNRRLFYGHVCGSDVVFGLNDFIQIDPSTAPSKGAPGGIDQTAAKGAFWKNQVANFNTAYKVIATERTTSVLGSGDPNGNDLLKLWMLCANNDEFGEAPKMDGTKTSKVPGEPDILLCNDVLYQQLHDLVQERLIFTNDGGQGAQMMPGAPWFRSAQVIWDPTMPTYTATYGNGWFLNIDAVKMVKAKGLEGTWGDMEPIPGKTGFGWPWSVQYSVLCNDRQKLGVIYNVKPATGP